MKKKINLYKSIFLICIIASFGMQLFYIVSEELEMMLMQKIIIVLIQFLSIGGYSHFYLINKDQEKKKKGYQRVHWLLFFIYLLNLIYVLFLDPDFGRQMLKETLSFEEYIQYNVNLDPFESIMLFVNGYQNGVVTISTLLRNLLGNFVVFMPMAYFLPILFKKQRKWYCFLITVFLLVLGVEMLQVFLRIGSGDIDDLLLNVIGSFFIYLILKCFPSHPYVGKE